MTEPIIAPKEVEVSAVPVTLIGTGPGTDMKGITAVTPSKNTPNIIVTSVISPLVAVLIRFIHLYLTTLVGLITAGVTPLADNLIAYTDFMTLVTGCMLLAIPGPAIGALKDIITIFGRLEGKFPLLTGNI